MKRTHACVVGSVLCLAAMVRGATPALPETPVLGKPYPVRASGQNSSVRLTVMNASLVDHYGPLKAPAGRRWVVLSTDWQNIIPLTDAADPASTAYKVPAIADHVYLVLDGRRVGRLAEAAAKATGHVPVRDLALDHIGDRLRGNLLFDVPADARLGWAELRYYDATGGPIVVRLGDPAEEARAKSPLRPITPAKENAILQAGVYGVKADPTSSAAPPGKQAVRIDFRAMSRMTLPAVSGSSPTPTVVDWTDSRKYLSLVVDGEYIAVPQEAPDTLPPTPRFLPDIATGGDLVFVVPKDATSLELRCDFPNAVIAGKQTRPTGLTLAVQGARPALVKRAALKTVDDDVFQVEITASHRTDTFAGKKPAAGEAFWVVDASVTNRGQRGEFFQTAEQLKYLSGQAQRGFDEVTALGPHPSPAVLWVPPAERRSFELVFRVPAQEADLRLAYNGVSKAEVLAFGGDTASPAGKPPAVVAQKPAGTNAPEKTTDPAKPAESKTSASKTESKSTESKPGASASASAEKPLVVDAHEFPARVAARPALAPKGLAGVGLTPEAVNQAIDRGAAALWARIRARNEKNRQSLGDERTDFIAALALVHAGYAKKDPAFDAALRGMLAKFDPRKVAQTYENGIACMLIEAYGDPTFIPQLQASAQWLLDQQGPGGTWTYGKGMKIPETAPPAPQVLQVVGGHPPDQKRGVTLVRSTDPKEFGDGDNSASQYALLGLHAATRSGMKLPAGAFKALLEATRERQNDDGGFAYSTSGSSYGSMTCAGVCAVALSEFEIGDKASWADPAVERGLAWLNAHFRVDNHPGYKDRWIYYYLYSIERVGRILDTEFIGSHEWYPAGAQQLVQVQKPNGLWFSDGGEEGEQAAEIPTSFALLFLTRATPSLTDPRVTPGPGTLKTATVVPPGHRLYVILDCSGSMLEEMEHRQKFEIAKDAVRALLAALPDNSEVALRAYGYRLRAIQEGANEDSKLLVPMEKIDRKKLGEFVDGLRARGKTPLAYSLEQAAGDIGNAATVDRPITVVLLTDGGEDTQPRRDPVKAAAAFAALKNVQLRIVGFDIRQDDWKRQLEAMARASAGQYLPAAESGELNRELKSAVFGIPEQFDVFDAQGKPVKSGAFGGTMPLEPGKYTFATTFAGRRFAEPFWISPGETTSITFDAAAIANDLRAAGQDAEAPSAPVPMSPAPGATAPISSAPISPGPAKGAPGAAPVPQPKFCVHCGAPLTPGAKFCTRCGAAVTP